jgi:hypothetical protein
MLETGRIEDLPTAVAEQLARLFTTDVDTVTTAHHLDLQRAASTARPTLSLRLTPAEADALADHLESADLGEHRDLLTAVTERVREAQHRAMSDDPHRPTDDHRP